MEKIIFDLNLEKCCACNACTIACMDQNDFDIESGWHPFRKAFEPESKNKEGEKFTFVSISCMHCDDAPCICSCPTGCLSKDIQTGLTIYDNSICIGCRSCLMACPFGAPSFDKQGKMIKCDGCYIRIKHGLKPACVKTCPSDALNFYTETKYKEKQGGKSLKSLVDKIL